ncbi:MAG: DUF4249 family protein [Bacteroidota bacterium]
MKHLFPGLLLAMFCSACIKEVSLPHPPFEPQWVIFGELISGQPVRIKIGLTQHPQDSLPPALPAQTSVSLWEDEQWVEDLSPGAEGWFEGSHRPQANRQYRVAVNAPNWPTAIARDQMPAPMPETEGFYQLTGLLTSYGTAESLSHLQWEDPEEEANFYEIDISLCNFDFDEIIDPAVLQEGDNDLYSCTPTAFFSDQSFEGQKYDFQWRSQCSSCPFLSPTQYPIEAIDFRVISEVGYRYRKSLVRHLAGQQWAPVDVASLEDWLDVLFLAEPAPLFTNVEQGVGIFMCSHKRNILLPHRP